MDYPTRTEIEELSPEERLKRIEDVWETLEAAPDSLGLSEEHSNILDQRLGELDRNPDSTIGWDEMSRQVRQRG
jgi:putative addiction module component (TIGR02574 family)